MMGHPSLAKVLVVVIVDGLASQGVILILYGLAQSYEQGLFCILNWLAKNFNRGAYSNLYRQAELMENSLSTD